MFPFLIHAPSKSQHCCLLWLHLGNGEFCFWSWIIKNHFMGVFWSLSCDTCPWESSASNHPSTSLAVIGLFSFTKGCSFFLTWTRDWGRLGQGFSVQRLAPWIAVINSRGNQCVLLSICKFTLERILGAGFSRRSKLRTLKSGWWYWSSSNHHGYWWLITSCGTKNPTKTRQSCLMMSASTK